MKVFCFEKENLVTDALGRVFSILTDSQFAKSIEDADIIVARSAREIEREWNRYPEKTFVVALMGDKSKHKLPSNVHEVYMTSIVIEIVQIMESLTPATGKTVERVIARPKAPASAPSVLVIDDTPTNIRSAEETIPFEYDLVTATGYDEAMELLSRFANMPFDFVLTDLHMPMSSRCLGPKAFRLGELVPYGLLIVMEALAMRTKEIAVVTDLNHHDDPFSAAFDHFTHEAIRTGKTRVRLLHAPLRPDGSKDWGKVLAG